MRRAIAWLLGVGEVAALMAGCGTTRRATESVVEHETQKPFYKIPSPLPAGAPGQLIRSERLLGAPDGSTA